MSADIIIIGGGIAGLSAGARLAPFANVTVLEMEDHLGYHSSGRSAALYEQNYGLPTTVSLNKASWDFYKDSPYLSPRGLMILGRAQDDAAFEKDLTTMGLDELSMEEATNLLPIINPAIVTRVAYHASAFDIDTDLLMQDFAKTIRQHGGQVHTKSAVKNIRKTGKGWDISTAQSTFKATTVVNAAGAWADQIASLAGVTPLGIVPHRRSMARIPLSAGLDPSSWPMFFGVGENWYAKPDAGKLLVSPADEDTTTAHDAYADDLTLAEGLARFEDVVTETVTRIDSNWAGLRSFSPDRALVLGRDKNEPEFVWCAAQGGYGFQTAPAASQLTADLILGQASLLDAATIAALSPHRFSK